MAPWSTFSLGVTLSDVRIYFACSAIFLARLGHSQLSRSNDVLYSRIELSVSDLFPNVRWLAGSIRRWKEDSIVDYLNEHLS